MKPNFSLIFALAAVLAAVLAAAPAGRANDLDVKDTLTGKLYARIDTSAGKILIELNTDATSKTVTNFIELAEGKKEFTDPQSKQPVKRPFYDGTEIFRVTSGHFIQGGCPAGDGTGGPGYTIENESAESSAMTAGSIAMFVKDGEVHGSQFILACENLDYLNGKYPVFGHAVYGTKLINTLSQAQVGFRNKPVTPIKVEHIEIIHAPAEPLVVLNALSYGAKVTVRISSPESTPSPYTDEQRLQMLDELKRSRPLERMSREDYIGTYAETYLDPEFRREIKEKRWKEKMEKELNAMQKESTF